MVPFDRLTEDERALVEEIWREGPDCAKFLSRRLRLPLDYTMDRLSDLCGKGWLSRVKGTFLFKRGFRRPKHMNHTYYQLTRKGEIFLREKKRRRV